MTTQDLALEILLQNDAHPARCFLAVRSIKVGSNLEMEAIALSVMEALCKDITRQYRIVVGQ